MGDRRLRSYSNYRRELPRASVEVVYQCYADPVILDPLYMDLPSDVQALFTGPLAIVLPCDGKGNPGSHCVGCVYGESVHREVQMESLESEALRKVEQQVINAQAAARQQLQEQYGDVWDKEQLLAEFEVMSFAAPYVGVKRKSDGQIGTVMFQHEPRFYFDWQPHTS